MTQNKGKIVKVTSPVNCFERLPNLNIFTLIYFPSKTHKIPTKDMISLQKYKTLVLALSSVLHLSHQHYKYISIHHLYNPPIRLSEEKQKRVEKQRRVRSPTKDMISLQKQNILVLPVSSVLHLSAYLSLTL